MDCSCSCNVLVPQTSLLETPDTPEQLFPETDSRGAEGPRNNEATAISKRQRCKEQQKWSREAMDATKKSAELSGVSAKAFVMYFARPAGSCLHAVTYFFQLQLSVSRELPARCFFFARKGAQLTALITN